MDQRQRYPLDDFGRFDGQVAVVTGGGGTLGGIVAAALAQRGAQVAVLDRAAGPEPVGHFVACDVTDAAAVRQAFNEAAARLGELDLLVCAAGVDSRHGLLDLTDEEWDRVVRVSLLGTFHCVRAAVPSMLRKGGGSIVAFSSGLGTKGNAQGAHYAAAKGGIDAFVKSVALEMAPRGIRANAVAPGPVRSALTEALAADFDAWAAGRGAQIPMGRIGEPEDFVGPVLFLLHPASGWVTGQVLHVNGGGLMP